MYMTNFPIYIHLDRPNSKFSNERVSSWQHLVFNFTSGNPKFIFFEIYATLIYLARNY